MLALVPVTWAQKNSSVQPEELPRHSAPNGAGHAIEVLERTVEALRQAHAEALELAQDRAQEAERERDEARMEVSALQMAVEQAEQQLTTVRYERERADAQAEELRERLQQMEAAEAHRRGQGRWRRLRAAWRGSE